MAGSIFINNLEIVNDGEGWSVIAPDGEVLDVFDDKMEAIEFAESVTDYANDAKSVALSRDDGRKRALVKTDEKGSKRSIMGRSRGELAESIPIDGTLAGDARSSRAGWVKRVGWTRIGGGLLVLLAATGVTVFLVAAVIPAGIDLFEELSIFVYDEATIPVLGVLLLGVPFVLWLLRNSGNRLLQGWLQPVVMGIGLVNSAISLVLGAIFLVVSFFSEEYDFVRALIVFGLWAFFSWTVVFFAREIDRIRKEGRAS